jgi:hypothetical protein
VQVLVVAAKTTDQTVARENLARQVAQLAAMLRGGRPGRHRHFDGSPDLAPRLTAKTPQRPPPTPPSHPSKAGHSRHSFRAVAIRSLAPDP